MSGIGQKQRNRLHGQNGLPNNPLEQDKSRVWEAFWIVFLLACLLFFPFIVQTDGYFTYYGDFNAQQIPFYRMCHDAVRAGDFSWNWTTDLGVNFMGSYSFYLLGSPFFWLTVPFPSSFVPYMMAPLLILKLSLMSVTAYLYLHRFVKSQYAVLGAIMYAFSGFSVYNIFFNHFHEAMIYLPLMLYALERYMGEGKRGLFALTVCLSALNNYYFFIGQCVFLILYWLVRLVSHAWEIKPARIIGIVIEAVVGTAMAALLLFPSYYAVIQNNRVSSTISGWSALYYNKPQRFWDIVHSFFFPADLPSRPNFFPEADNKWASMSAWLPMFGCTGAMAFFQSRKHTNWLHRLLIILVICALIPLFNAMFQLFNAQYYARWFYMITLMLITATMMALESKPTAPPVNWVRAFGWSGGITLFFVGIIAFMPTSWTADETTGKLDMGLYQYADRFWIYVAVALVGLVLAGLVVYLRQKQSDSFYSIALICLCTVCLGYSWYVVGTGHEVSTYHDKWVEERAIQGIDNIDLPESDEWSRIDVNSCLDNLGIYWELPCIQAFHSIVPGSVTDFYESIGVHRGVGSRPATSIYAIRGFLSVKWTFDYANTEGKTYSKNATDYFEQPDGTLLAAGWTYDSTQNGFKVYRNDNFIPMGYTYDGYITLTEYKQLSCDENRQEMLLKALVVDDEDESVAASLLPHYDVSSAIYGYEIYKEDCAARRATAATSFEANSSQFTSTITMDTPNYAFFTVPYEGGWTATVNGKEVDILKGGVGFMAVPCEAGENHIVFTYRTPGLVAGAAISGASVVVLVVYFFLAPRVSEWWEKRRQAAMAKAAADASDDTEE